MKKVVITLAALPMCLCLGWAQDNAGTPQSTNQMNSNQMNSGSGQTWVGILVDANCSTLNSSASMPSSTASDMNRQTTMSSSTDMNRQTASGTYNGTMNRQTTNGTNDMNRGTVTDQQMNQQNNGWANRTNTNNTAYPNNPGMNNPAANNNSTYNSGRNPNYNSSTSNQAYNSRSNNTGMNNSGYNSNPNNPSYNSTANNSNYNSGMNNTAANGTSGWTNNSMNRTTTGQQTAGTADRAMNGTNGDTGYMAKQTSNSEGSMSTNQNWDRSCYISPASSAFLLQLQNGRVVRLDDAGNSRVVSQLQSTNRVSTNHKIFRAKVNGTMDGDTIRVIDIIM